MLTPQGFAGVRAPGLQRLDARRQCNGDWEFWLSCGLDFLEAAESQLENPMDDLEYEKAAHRIKSGAAACN